MNRLPLCVLPALLLTVAAPASADGPKVINADLVGSVPNVLIRGVPSGGAPWVVKGKAQLDPDGRLRVRGRGLLIVEGARADGSAVPPAVVGTVGPVVAVQAALTYAIPGSGVPSFEVLSDPVPLSPAGDFEIEQLIPLPPTLDQPILLIRIATDAGPGPWIAVTR